MNRVFDLSGRRILVTGGASGIGQTTATLLTGLGAAVTLMDRDKDRLTDAAGTAGATAIFQGDVTSEEDCEAMVVTARKAMGGLAGLWWRGAGRHPLILLRGRWKSAIIYFDSIVCLQYYEVITP